MDDFFDLREDMKQFKKANFMRLYLFLTLINAITLMFNYNFQISPIRYAFFILIGYGTIAYKFLKIVRNEGIGKKDHKAFSINGGIVLFFLFYFTLIAVLPNLTYLLHYKVGIMYNLILGIIHFIAMLSIFCIYDNDGKLHRILVHILKIVVNEWKCIDLCILLYGLWRIGMCYFMYEPMKAYFVELSIKEIIAIQNSGIISPFITRFLILFIIDLLVGTFLQVRMYLYFVFIYERN